MLMLVYFPETQSIGQMFKSSGPMNCGVCRRLIARGEYHTRHLAPDFQRYDHKTGKTPTIVYKACLWCVPVFQLENHTGEFSLGETIERVARDVLSIKETREVPIITKSLDISQQIRQIPIKSY